MSFFRAETIINPSLGCCRPAEPALCEWTNHRPAVTTWADEARLGVAHTGHRGRITPSNTPALSCLVHSVGKLSSLQTTAISTMPPLPKKWLSHGLSHWSGFCLVTFFYPISSRQLNPLHQILSFSLNNGQSHINTQKLLSLCPVPEVASLPQGVLFVCTSGKEAEMCSQQGRTWRGGVTGREVIMKGCRWLSSVMKTQMS